MDRRSFLQTTALGSLGAAALDPSDLPSGAEPNTPDNRPNVLVILADDMGFSDLGCYGSTVDTPNIDRLAEEGMRFSQMYNAARCTPTRGSLMTGLHPHQAGMGHMRADLEISASTGGEDATVSVNFASDKGITQGGTSFDSSVSMVMDAFFNQTLLSFAMEYQDGGSAVSGSQTYTGDGYLDEATLTLEDGAEATLDADFAGDGALSRSTIS